MMAIFIFEIHLSWMLLRYMFILYNFIEYTYPHYYFYLATHRGETINNHPTSSAICTASVMHSAWSLPINSLPPIRRHRMSLQLLPNINFINFAKVQKSWTAGKKAEKSLKSHNHANVKVNATQYQIAKIRNTNIYIYGGPWFDNRPQKQSSSFCGCHRGELLSAMPIGFWDFFAADLGFVWVALKWFDATNSVQWLMPRHFLGQPKSNIEDNIPLQSLFSGMMNLCLLCFQFIWATIYLHSYPMGHFLVRETITHCVLYY